MQVILLFKAMVTAVLHAALAHTLEGDEANMALAQRHKEDGMLVDAGFTPEEEGGDCWKRDNVFFGREAALQRAWREWHKH